jgi:hypothetical protein
VRQDLPHDRVPTYEGRPLVRPHDEVVDQGLGFDVTTLMSRRRLLRALGLCAATVGLAACASNSGSTASSTSAGEIPDETAGPYPGDGSNGPNVLSESGIVRSDIRSSFGEYSGTAEGVPMTLELAVRDLAAGGVPFEGVAVYVWHCSREGGYSLYSAGFEARNYLFLVPLMGAGAGIVLARLGRAVPEPATRNRLGALVVAAAVVTSGVAHTQAHGQIQRFMSELRDVMPVIRPVVEAGATIFATKPHLAFHLGGRRGHLPTGIDLASLPAALRSRAAEGPVYLFLGELEWTGVAMVEFKLGIDGATLMEINGRIWGSLPLAVKSGMDFPARLAELYLSGPPENGHAPETSYQVGVRSRNLDLEVLWIASALRRKRRFPFLPRPSRRDALAAGLRLLSPADGFDVLSRRDPRPGLAEIAGVASKLRRKAVDGR